MITVACQCGKKFRTSDANAGKRTKCTGCGQVLTIPRPAPAAAAPEPVDEDSLDSLSALAAASGAEVYQPAEIKPLPKSGTSGRSAAAAKAAYPGVPPVSKSERPQRKGESMAPSISVSPLLVALIILAIMIPLAIYWVEHGPMEASRKWKEISTVAEENITGQGTRAIQYEYKTTLAEQMEGLAFRPHVKSIYFVEPPVMLSLPDTVNFQMFTTEGTFNGQFHPKTWQFEMKGSVAGVLHTFTGSASASDQSLYMDGTKIN